MQHLAEALMMLQNNSKVEELEAYLHLIKSRERKARGVMMKRWREAQEKKWHESNGNEGDEEGRAVLAYIAAGVEGGSICMNKRKKGRDAGRGQGGSVDSEISSLRNDLLLVAFPKERHGDGWKQANVCIEVESSRI